MEIFFTNWLTLPKLLSQNPISRECKLKSVVSKNVCQNFTTVCTCCTLFSANHGPRLPASSLPHCPHIFIWSFPLFNTLNIITYLSFQIDLKVFWDETKSFEMGQNLLMRVPVTKAHSSREPGILNQYQSWGKRLNHKYSVATLTSMDMVWLMLKIPVAARS